MTSERPPYLGPAGDPGTSARVDILREPVELTQQIGNALRLWLIGNDLHDTTFRWPVMVDFDRRRVWITDEHGQELTVPLQRAPLAPLWRSLADRGALWCARPDHATLDDPRCPERVNVDGQHTQYVEHQTLADRQPRLIPVGGIASHPNTEQRPAPADVDTPLELAITQALERAAPGCEHPDPGQPIYDHTRACAQCGAAAVLQLFRTADVITLLQRRALAQQDQPLQAGYWIPGHGYVPTDHPQAQERREAAYR